MGTLACPGCKTPFSAELFEQGRRPRCPFCGADLTAANPDSVPVPLSDLQDLESDLAQATQPAPEVSTPVVEPPKTRAARIRPQGTLPPLPAKSRLKVLKDSQDHLIVQIPPSQFIETMVYAKGCVVSVLMVGAIGLLGIIELILIVAGKGANSSVWLLLAAGPFLFVVALWLTYVWARFQFEWTDVSVDRARIRVRRRMLGREKISELLLTAPVQAELAHCFFRGKSSEVVGVFSAAGWLGFGDSVDTNDRKWLVNRIGFLIHPLRFEDDYEGVIRPLPRWRQTPLLPSTNVPKNCGIVIEQDDQEQFRFSYPARSSWGAGEKGPANVGRPEKSSMRSFFIRSIAFCVFWYGLLIVSAIIVMKDGFDRDDWETYLTIIAGVLLGIMLTWKLLMLAWGRITVEMDFEEVRCRWSIGKFGFTESIKLWELNDVYVTRIPDRTLPVVRSILGMGLAPASVIDGPKDARLKLTLCHSENFSRLISALVRTRCWPTEESID